MNRQGIVDRNIEKNLRILGVKKFDPQAHISKLTPKDRPAIERALRRYYAQMGLDQTTSEAMLPGDVGKLIGGNNG